MRIKNSDIAKFAFFFFLVGQTFTPGIILTFIAIITILIYLIAFDLHVNKKLFSLIMPFLLLLLIGSVFAYQNSIYGVGKDVLYFGKVIITLSLGFLFAKSITDIRVIYKIIIAAAVISAIVHLIQIGLYYKPGMTLLQLRREEAVRGYVITIIGLVLLWRIRDRRNNILSDRLSYFFAVSTCTLSFLLSFSRTYIIFFITMLFMIQGWGKIDSKKNIIRLFFVVSIISIVVVSGFYELDADGERGLSTKILHTTQELKIQNYENKQDINLNWRGFESYRALVDYQEGSILQKLFGQGMGATVDLGFYMNLGGKDIRYIPILHNGYMYILVKVGIFGLIIYLYFFYNIVKQSSVRKNHLMVTIDETPRKILVGLVWIFVFSTFVITGIFNGSLFSAILLAGYLYSYLNNQKKFA